MIDFHTHPVMIKELIESAPDLFRNIREVFGFFFPPQPLDCFLLEMDEANIDKAILLPIDCTSAHGCKIVSNEQVAQLVEKQSRFIGFASVDPSLPTAVKDLERAVRSLGLRGLKLDPSLQNFKLDNTNLLNPLFEICEELHIPILIHCGMSLTPSGLAQNAQPILLEKSIQKFPSVNFILAHFAWPWVQEATMLAIKYPNVYLDTAILYSGTPQDALKQVLINQVGFNVIERSLSHKILFGSNYPRVDMRRSVRGFLSLGLSNHSTQAILHENASRILSLPRS